MLVNSEICLFVCVSVCLFEGGPGYASTWVKESTRLKGDVASGAVYSIHRNPRFRGEIMIWGRSRVVRDSRIP